MARLWLLLAVCALTAAPRQGATLDEHRARREALRKALPESVIVLFGGTERERGDLRGGFFQEPNFFYLTGWQEQGAILLLTPNDETLFLPGRSEVRERYTGRKAAPADDNIREATGFHNVMAVEKFETVLSKAAESASKVYALPALAGADKLKSLLPLREIADVSRPIARLRMIKSPREIELIEHTTRITLEAHRAAWKRMAPGLFEYQIAATMSNVYFEHGCERHAYAPIVGSGPNAAILHYARNGRHADSGELMLMDVGAECSLYAADITRTVPVAGRFTPRQRELYEIVLGAQKAAIAAAKPGMMLLGQGEKSLNRIAREYMDAHGKARNGDPLSKYFSHGLGHHVGLDVHDANDPDLPLAAGMVITIEPGLYIPEEAIGIRVEDMVLITEGGSRVLSAALPREANDIEKAVAKRNGSK